jgi:hypothetical protein
MDTNGLGQAPMIEQPLAEAIQRHPKTTASYPLQRRTAFEYTFQSHDDRLLSAPKEGANDSHPGAGLCAVKS